MKQLKPSDKNIRYMRTFRNLRLLAPPGHLKNGTAPISESRKFTVCVENTPRYHLKHPSTASSPKDIPELSKTP